jgi:hypothetical protein
VIDGNGEVVVFQLFGGIPGVRFHERAEVGNHLRRRVVVPSRRFDRSMGSPSVT